MSKYTVREIIIQFLHDWWRYSFTSELDDEDAVKGPKILRGEHAIDFTEAEWIEILHALRVEANTGYPSEKEFTGPWESNLLIKKIEAELKKLKEEQVTERYGIHFDHEDWSYIVLVLTTFSGYSVRIARHFYPECSTRWDKEIAHRRARKNASKLADKIESRIEYLTMEYGEY